MYRKAQLVMLFIIMLASSIYCQKHASALARDTIITMNRFPNNIYILNGKKLTLPVMEWFMSDYPTSNRNIKVALVSDQMSIVGYSVGGLFAVTGLIAFRQNETLGKELFKVSIISLGSGFAFQLLSGAFKQKAVNAYNRALHTQANAKGGGVYKMGMTDKKVGLWVTF
ncbi:MAG: hypothetical protein DHS20C18_30560 [Saprospiraceae bacterium]|nr:MAG: hypothetical protein DHS20C18_30560 [Saprospiraceae bacterium]